MKTRRFLLFVLAIALISSLLVIIPSAKGGRLEVSEDYLTLSYNGNSYTRSSQDTLYGDYSDRLGSGSDFALTATQKQEISSIAAYIYDDVYIYLEIYFNKGGYIREYYLNDEYSDDYEYFLANGGSTYTFYNYDQYKSVSVDKKDFLTSSSVMKKHEIAYYTTFAPVETVSENGYFNIQSGYIICDSDGNYFYYDIYDFESPDDNVTVWKLDKALFVEDNIEIDIEFDNGVVIGFAGVILSLFFGAIPLAGLIVALILSFKSKQPYRRGLRILAIICAVEIVAFVVTMTTLLAA